MSISPMGMPRPPITNSPSTRIILTPRCRLSANLRWLKPADIFPAVGNDAFTSAGTFLFAPAMLLALASQDLGRALRNLPRRNQRRDCLFVNGQADQ